MASVRERLGGWLGRLRRVPRRPSGPIPADVAAAWAWRLEQDLDPAHGWAAVLAQQARAADDIAATRSPDSSVGHAVRNALDVACGDPVHRHVGDFLARAVALADAADAHACRWGERWSTRNGERGRYIEAAALARAWHGEAAPEPSRLAAAADDMLAASEHRWHGHEAQQQSLCLRALQCLLLAGADEQARRLADRRLRRFGTTRRYADWTRDVVALCATGAAPGPEGIARFDALFEPLRHPGFHPLGGAGREPLEASRVRLPAGLFDACRGWSFFGDDLLRLRLALLRWQRVLRRPVAGQWRSVVGQINLPQPSR